MVDRSPDELTLRELFTEAERLTRELTEHLEQGFLPKVQALERLADASQVDSHGHPIEDITVRNGAAQVLQSEAYTDQLCEKVEQLCDAIDRNVRRVITES